MRNPDAYERLIMDVIRGKPDTFHAAVTRWRRPGSGSTPSSRPGRGTATRYRATRPAPGGHRLPYGGFFEGSADRAQTDAPGMRAAEMSSAGQATQSRLVRPRPSTRHPSLPRLWPTGFRQHFATPSRRDGHATPSPCRRGSTPVRFLLRRVDTGDRLAKKGAIGK